MVVVMGVERMHVLFWVAVFRNMGPLKDDSGLFSFSRGEAGGASPHLPSAPQPPHPTQPP